MDRWCSPTGYYLVPCDSYSTSSTSPLQLTREPGLDLGNIGIIYSLGELAHNNVTPCFLTCLGCHRCFALFTPMSQVSLYIHSFVSLLKSTRFVFLTFLNITAALHTCRNILTLSFFACYSSHLYVHFQMHSPSVEKPNFGNTFLLHPSAPACQKCTPYCCSPLKYHAQHLIISSHLLPQLCQNHVTPHQQQC